MKKREDNFPKFKLFVSIPGDESVGIFPGEAIVTIQDNILYSTEEDVNDLKQSIASMYDVPVECVRTELEEYRGRMKNLKMELNILLSEIENLDISDSYKIKKMNNYRRIMEKQKRNCQNHIRSLKKFYDTHKFFYKKLA